MRCPVQLTLPKKLSKVGLECREAVSHWHAELTMSLTTMHAHTLHHPAGAPGRPIPLADPPSVPPCCKGSGGAIALRKRLRPQWHWYRSLIHMM